MNNFTMMVGLPGGGKSTYAKELSKTTNAIIHSSDSLREELFGDVNECNKNEELFKELHRRIKNDLSNGKNVVYDATNINYKKRTSFLQEIKKFSCYKKCILIATPYEDCLEYNLKRERQVPEHVIKKMYKNIFIPQWYEGWDDIEIKFNNKKEYVITNLMHRLKEIEQDNSNHTLTIGNHCLKCLELVEQKTNNINLSYAALLHDIGKEFTKEFKNSKGEDTVEAHYYQHHLVSAYDSIFYLDSIQNNNFDLFKTIALITWHMQPFFIKTEKAKNKFVKLVGQEFYHDIMLLHEADKMAK